MGIENTTTNAGSLQQMTQLNMPHGMKHEMLVAGIMLNWPPSTAKRSRILSLTLLQNVAVSDFMNWEWLQSVCEGVEVGVSLHGKTEQDRYPDLEYQVLIICVREVI